MAKIDKATRIAYAFPNFIIACVNTYVDAHITQFYLAKISAAKLGLISGILGTLGLFFDMIISYFVDNFHSTNFLVLCSVIYSTSTFALFNPIGKDETSFVIWFTIWNLIKSITPLTLLYDTLGNILTRNVNLKERDDVFAYKHFFGLFGGILAFFLPNLWNLILKDSSSHQKYILSQSVVMVLAFVIMASKIPKMEIFVEKRKQVAFIPSIKQSFQNKGFRVLLILSLYEALRGLFWNGVFPLYYTHVLGLAGNDYNVWFGIFHISGLVLASLFTPVWMYLSKTFGTRRTWLIAYIFEAPMGIFVYFLVKRNQIWKYFFFYILMQICGRAPGFLFDSVKNSVMIYEEFLTGQRRYFHFWIFITKIREASIETAWRFIPRYISLPGSAVSFWILAKCGYKKDQSQISQSVVKCISIQATLFPSVTSFLVLYIMYKFPITDEILPKIVKGIELHKKGKSAIDPITKKEVPPPQKDDEFPEKETLDHFWKYELTYFLKKRKVLFNEILMTGIFLTGSIISFIRFIISLSQSNELYSTLYLWISSILFSLSIFHFYRIQPSKKLKKIPKEKILKYLE